MSTPVRWTGSLRIHPGEVLRKQFLTPMGISQCALARATGTSAIHINNIVLGRRDVTVDTDARLAAALGTVSSPVKQTLQK